MNYWGVFTELIIVQGQGILVKGSICRKIFQQSISLRKRSVVANQRMQKCRIRLRNGLVHELSPHVTAIGQ